MSDEKKPITHPDYECWPGGPLNWSKYSRENIPKPPHRFKVGDVVRLTVVCEVLELTRDCDGEALYTLDLGRYGWGEEKLEPATEEEVKNVHHREGPLKKAKARLARYRAMLEENR